MTFQIRRLVLFSHAGEVRSLDFRTNSVNIITGSSKTGKSAIIHIIDYCLGGSESFIPEGVIVKSCSWYGVQISSAKEELFIARRNAGPGAKSSEDIYVVRGTDVAIPKYKDVRQNINSDGLRELLSTFVGISDYSHQVKAGQTRKTGAANIGKALIYCFQEQSEIDNQKFLFHRQGEPHLPQSIQDYMPYFLGAVSQDYAVNKEKLRSKSRQLKILEDQKRERENIKGRTLVRALSLVQEAKYVGLLEQDKSVNDDWADIKVVLSEARNKNAEERIDSPANARQVQTLQTKLSELRNQHRAKSDEVTALTDLKNGGNGFSHEATEQKARLSSIGLIPEVGAKSELCPLCHSSNGHTVPAVKALKASLGAIASQLKNVGNDISNIDKMISRAEDEREKISLEMKQAAQTMESLYEQDKKLQQLRDDNSKRALIQGRIGLYLEALQEPEKDLDEDKKISALFKEVERLEKLVGQVDIGEKFNSILNILSEKISALARHLGLEHSEYSLRLDPKKLTVVADTEDGPLPLAKMGSGDTWVSLHLIVHLVLHQWFQKKNLPVPNFIVFDQPSQAYFPPETPELAKRNTDKDAVQKMFKMIKEQTNGFQVIITEHADIAGEWYQEMVLEKWWDGKTKLVPIDWPKS